MGSRVAKTNTAPIQIPPLNQTNFFLNLKALRKTTKAKHRELPLTGNYEIRGHIDAMPAVQIEYANVSLGRDHHCLFPLDSPQTHCEEHGPIDPSLAQILVIARHELAVLHSALLAAVVTADHSVLLCSDAARVGRRRRHL